MQIGKDGVTGGLIHAVDRALTDHELIKVRVLLEAPIGRRDAADLVAIRTGATVAQVLGRTFLLYRPSPDKPRIVLPQKASENESEPRP